MSADLRLFIMVIAAGALGSLLHSLTSFADYVGNRKLSKNWIWWIVLRTPIGIGLALLFYVVLRGGLIVPSFSTPATATPNSTALMNPYPIAAIAALAGMFSKQATDKVSEVFNTLFRMQQPVQRGDSLSDTTPVITSVEPGKLTVNGAKDLTIRGSHFQPECKVTVDGEARAAERVSETEIKLTLDAKDVAAVKKLALVVQNPGPTPHASKPFQVEVEP